MVLAVVREETGGDVYLSYPRGRGNKNGGNEKFPLSPPLGKLQWKYKKNCRSRKNCFRPLERGTPILIIEKVKLSAEPTQLLLSNVFVRISRFPPYRGKNRAWIFQKLGRWRVLLKIVTMSVFVLFLTFSIFFVVEGTQLACAIYEKELRSTWNFEVLPSRQKRRQYFLKNRHTMAISYQGMNCCCWTNIKVSNLSKRERERERKRHANICRQLTMQ